MGESVAVKLGLKKSPDILAEQHYPTYLTMAKNFMEGESRVRVQSSKVDPSSLIWDPDLYNGLHSHTLVNGISCFR